MLGHQSSLSDSAGSYRPLGSGSAKPLPRRPLSALKRPLVYAPILAIIIFCTILYAGKSSTSDSDLLPPQPGKKTFSFHGLQDSFDLLASAASGEAKSHGEFSCDPFAEKGRLHVNADEPTKNVWTPFDLHCPASNYMKALYRPQGDTSALIPKHSVMDAEATSDQTRRFLPWLVNRTVVIHGDSIDRFHLKDFCAFVGGNLFVISPDHPASPPPYHMPSTHPLYTPDRSGKETFWEGRPQEGWELTNPWVCDVQEYGFTLVNVFTWGLQGAEEFFQTERWYYPPATWVDRMDAITTPLIERLSKFLKRPQILSPDLVQLNSGFWDLRKYTEEDFVAAGFPNRPYPEDSGIPYTNLSPAREITWEKEARIAIKKAAKTFRSAKGKSRSGPVLLWRTLHHPPRHNYAPYPRVFALDSLARKVINDLRIESLPSYRGPKPLRLESATNSVDGDQEQSREEEQDQEDLGLDERLRIDESGALMLGQEHHFRDLLHPHAVPGSYLWGNVMLYELKRAVKRIDRSSL